MFFVSDLEIRLVRERIVFIFLYQIIISFLQFSFLEYFGREVFLIDCRKFKQTFFFLSFLVQLYFIYIVSCYFILFFYLRLLEICFFVKIFWKVGVFTYFFRGFYNIICGNILYTVRFKEFILYFVLNCVWIFSVLKNQLNKKSCSIIVRKQFFIYFKSSRFNVFSVIELFFLFRFRFRDRSYLVILIMY